MDFSNPYLISWFPYDFIHTYLILAIHLGRLNIVSTCIFLMRARRAFNTHIKVVSNDVEVVSMANTS